MSSSSEFRHGLRGPDGDVRTAVVTETHDGGFEPLATPELRSGTWTRLGERSLLGDTVSEQLLSRVAESARTAAEAQGYAVGWAQGVRAAAEEATTSARRAEELRREAERRREAEHRQAIAALTLAATELREQLGALSERVESQATQLAWAITESLVGRELASVTGTDVVRRVVSVLPATTCTVRLHPNVVSSEAAEELRERGVVVVPDPTLDLADALVLTDGSVVDLRIAEAMTRVRDALR